MDTATLERFLEPPPRLYPLAEALPHLGGLVLPEYVGELPDEMELHPVEPLRDEFSDSTAQAMMERALATPEVRERLARGRVIGIGVSRRGQAEKRERHTYLAVLYDYTANLAVEVYLDEQGALISMNDHQYQPPPTESEVDRAIELARGDDRLSDKVSNLVGLTIPYAGPDNEFADRRVLEVLFGDRTERLPRFRAWVDLGTETVLHVGEVCECGNQLKGRQS
jgi:hypothetical protein